MSQYLQSIHLYSCIWLQIQKLEEQSWLDIWMEYKRLSNHSKCIHHCRHTLICLDSKLKMLDRLHNFHWLKGNSHYRCIFCLINQTFNFFHNLYRRHWPWIVLKLSKHIFCQWYWKLNSMDSQESVYKCHWLCKIQFYKHIRLHFMWLLVESLLGMSNLHSLISNCSKWSLHYRHIPSGLCQELN